VCASIPATLAKEIDGEGLELSLLRSDNLYIFTSIHTIGATVLLRSRGTKGDIVSLSAEERQSPKLVYQDDPIGDSLHVLGAKWSLIIIRDVAFLRLHHFGEIRRNNPGLTARVLSRRLRQLVSEGLLERLEDKGEVRYELTSKGEDAVYILLALLRYGMRHHMKKKQGKELTEEEAMRRLSYSSPFEYHRSP
jgi:DNA-binding HxlR family transcriptional regulator